MYISLCAGQLMIIFPGLMNTRCIVSEFYSIVLFRNIESSYKEMYGEWI